MISSAATMTAFTPLSVRLEWASRPVTVVRNERMPLWAFTTFMSVGSPMIASFGRGQVVRDVGDHGSDAEAADFFVVGERDVDGCLDTALQELRHERERDGGERFHIRRAAAV